MIWKGSYYKIGSFFCYGDEENAQSACANEYLTTVNQSGIREANFVSVVLT